MMATTTWKNIIPTKAIRPQTPCPSTQARKPPGSWMNRSMGRPTASSKNTLNATKAAMDIPLQNRFCCSVNFPSSRFECFMLMDIGYPKNVAYLSTLA